jgi:Bacterial PH domain
VRTEKFRYNAAVTIAAVVAFFGAVPLATSRAYLLPILLVPILVAVWGWRAGTDVSTAGLRIRALFGSRLIPWPYVNALVPAGRGRVYAVLYNGRQLRLPAVTAADLPRLSEKSGPPSGEGTGDSAQ